MIDRQLDYIPRIVKKSNILIEHSRKLTLLSYKFFDLLISNVQDLNEANKFSYDIYVPELQKLIGSGKNYQSYGKLKKVVDNLLTEIIELISPKITSFNTTTFISSAKLSKKVLTIEISNSLKSLIDLNYQHSLENKTINYGFTPIDLNITNKLKSKYSLALYEYLLKELKLNTRFQKSKNECSFDLNLDFLYTFLCNKQDAYKNIDAFKRRILKPAIEEINQKTDLEISYQDIKCEFNNKTITGFEFTIKQNEINQIILNDIKEVNKESKKELENILPKPKEIYPILVQDLITIGITAKKAIDMHTKDNERLKAIYDEINTSYAKKNNIEKQKLIVGMFNNGVYPNFVSPTEKLAQEQKEITKNLEIQARKQQALIEQKKQTEREIIKQNNKQIFENELKKEESQLSKIWKAITKEVEVNIPTQQVRTWFSPAIANIENNTLNILLPNRFKYDFFKNKLATYVYEALKNMNLILNINMRVGI